jgi:adenylate cyclase
VIFGARMPCEEHLSKAMACGLAMQLAMPGMNRVLAGQGAPVLKMGIGIHTGRVVVGNSWRRGWPTAERMGSLPG